MCLIELGPKQGDDLVPAAEAVCGGERQVSEEGEPLRLPDDVFSRLGRRSRELGRTENPDVKGRGLQGDA